MKKFLFHLATGLLLTFTTFTAHAQKEMIPIGALLSLSGSWESLGQTSLPAIEYALQEINEYLESIGNPKEFHLLVEDTATTADQALQKIEILHGLGVRFIVGPQASSEVAAILEYANQNRIMVVSQGSTAHSLAVNDDYIFRLVPDDRVEGLATATLMREEEIETLVLIGRDDAGNNGLQESVRLSFEAMGGRAFSTTTYPPTLTDFNSTAQMLRSLVEDALTLSDASKVAVYLASFDEGVGLMEQAHGDSILRSVKWYAGDGLAHSSALLNNPLAIEFAQQVGMPAPIFGLDEIAQARWQGVKTHVETTTGRPVDAFTLAAYDATWLGALSYLAAGDSENVDALKTALPTLANTFFGASGWTALNEAGDRRTGNFDFWAVREGANGPEWTQVAQFIASSPTEGRIVYTNPDGETRLNSWYQY